MSTPHALVLGRAEEAFDEGNQLARRIRALLAHRLDAQDEERRIDELRNLMTQRRDAMSMWMSCLREAAAARASGERARGG